MNIGEVEEIQILEMTYNYMNRENMIMMNLIE
jgi:hypothetical protein